MNSTRILSTLCENTAQIDGTRKISSKYNPTTSKMMFIFQTSNLVVKYPDHHQIKLTIVRSKDIHDSDSDLITSPNNILDLNELLKFFQLTNHLHLITNYFTFQLNFSNIRGQST
jgi:hypothetical protein